MRFRWLLTTLIVISGIQVTSAQEKRPNVILIMCDDMGFSDLGCYGSEINTPNIDQLAKDGMRFTQFYNNAKCTTTRASIITGLYPRKTLLTKRMVTLAEVLKDADYHTSLSGKWHLGSGNDRHPVDRGFEEYYGLLDGCCNFFNPSQRDPKFKGGRIRKWGHNNKFIKEFPEDFYATDAITDHAIECIQNFGKSEKPFFVHVCYTAPHYPLHAKPEDIKKYVGKYKSGWNVLRKQRHERQLKMGLINPAWKLSGMDSRARKWESARQEHEDLRMAVYAAMIDCMDQNVGRMMKTLRDLKLEENTLVLFLSDNGGCAEEPEGKNNPNPPGPGKHYTSVGPSWGWAQNTPFRRYKSWVHEGGISTPLIARWPGVIKPGTFTNEVGHIIDFMPTFIEMAKTKYPLKREGNDILPLDGRSLLPILQGKRQSESRTLAWEWSGNKAYRSGKWKVVWDKLVKKWELYDLEADRTETNNLADKHPEMVEEMVTKYDEWAKKCGRARAK